MQHLLGNWCSRDGAGWRAHHRILVPLIRSVMPLCWRCARPALRTGWRVNHREIKGSREGRAMAGGRLVMEWHRNSRKQGRDRSGFQLLCC
eukprot:1254229-Rhodomonas_salina.1